MLLVLSTASGRAQGPHDGLTWSGPGTCRECHPDEALEVHGSVMYQWQGSAPDMVGGPESQGKIAGGVNSYCISILGNWTGCSTCHLGLGELPQAEPTAAQLDNIDCMLCHQQEYRRQRVGGTFEPDLAAMSITMDEAVQTVHLPERFNCLQCHAKAGGGDAVKRGDLAMAHVATADEHFDVHMATTEADLRCQDCHTFSQHRVAGKGSDLRPTDSDEVLECSNCHADMVTGHATAIDRHIERVACQACHVPVYAKNAADTAATEATEVHRTWLGTHSTEPPYHPISDRRNDLTPHYRFWNRKSRNALLYEVPSIDPATGRRPTSRPQGTVFDPEARLYAFKYKTALQPLVSSSGQLVALDTSVFFATADADAATRQGLLNMGLADTEPYEWVETDTFQMLNHQVAEEPLRCDDCHGVNGRVASAGLGYDLWAEPSEVCVQCHGPEDEPRLLLVSRLPAAGAWPDHAALALPGRVRDRHQLGLGAGPRRVRLHLRPASCSSFAEAPPH
jgi:hypothetical protein